MGVLAGDREKTQPGADLLIVEQCKGGLSSILGLNEQQFVLLHLVQDALQQNQ